MSKQKSSKDKSIKIDEQIEFMYLTAAYITERTWKILDEYKVSYNPDYDTEKETIEEAMAKMFNDMHLKFFAMIAGQLYSVLTVIPHPEIHKDKNHKVLDEWFHRQTKADLDKIVISDSRTKKFDSIIKLKTEN